jgi:hypothetical protein
LARSSSATTVTDRIMVMQDEVYAFIFMQKLRVSTLSLRL